ncbi:MAG: hypothetical protein ACYCPQ_07785 [Elusimicrobiota bacterium]
MRYFGFLLAAALSGCAHSGAVVQAEDGLSLAQYQGIGVAPFNDPRGHGAAIAADIETGLERLMYAPVDPAVLAQILSKHRLDRRSGLSLEVLENIRDKTSADAIIMGRMAPDWSAASIVMVETAMGDQVLHAILKPAGRNEKAFSSPDEVSQAALKVLAGLH